MIRYIFNFYIFFYPYRNEGHEYRNALCFFVCVTNFQYMRRFVSHSHVTSGLLAPLSEDLVVFSFRLRMWDLIFLFVINYKFVFFALLVYLRMNRYF